MFIECPCPNYSPKLALDIQKKMEKVGAPEEKPGFGNMAATGIHKDHEEGFEGKKKKISEEKRTENRENQCEEEGT